MTTRIQKLLVIGCMVLALGIALLEFLAGRPLRAIGGLAAITAGYAGVLTLEFWLLWRSFDPADAMRPTPPELVRAWARELFGAPVVFLWRQPFRSRREPDHLLPATGGKRGVLFVHGFFCNRGIWNPWLKRLRAIDIPFIAINLTPVLGSIDRYTEAIDTAARELEAATGLAPIAVAHSMGGLAVRASLARDRQKSERIHHVVTIATPHGGTTLARFATRGNTAEMRINSPWLRSLAAAEAGSPARRFTCFWSHCDNIVFPARNATLPDADNRHLGATPHVQMIYHPAVFEEVLRLLESSTMPAQIEALAS